MQNHKITFQPLPKDGSGTEAKCLIPELSDGFDRREAGSGPGLVPVTWYSREVPCGIYRIHLSLRAREDVSRLFLFTGRKQLREILSLKKGQCIEQVFYLSAAEIIPRYHDKACPISRLYFSFCTSHPEHIEIDCCWGEAADDSALRIFLCGDSTVTDQASEIPYHPGGCYSSWGQDLPVFLTGAAAVENQAHCGLTTESFRNEGHFALVQKHLRPGDLCLFQFGHNDQKLPHLLASREYPQNLKRFIDEVRALKGVPVLVTPLGRNTWTAQNQYLDLLEEHAEAVFDVSMAECVPLIGLHKFSINFYTMLGKEKAKNYFHPGDYTHTNEYGSYLFASFIGRELSSLFPDLVCSRMPAGDFSPPADLWETLSSETNRKETADEKEIFDQAEKALDNLLKMVEQAKTGDVS